MFKNNFSHILIFEFIFKSKRMKKYLNEKIFEFLESKKDARSASGSKHIRLV